MNKNNKIRKISGVSMLFIACFIACIVACFNSCKDDTEGRVTAITLKEGVWSSTASCMQLTLKDNETLQVTPFIMPRDANNQKVTYSNMFTNLMTVNENGLITAKAPGIDTLTVSATDGSGISTWYQVVITDHQVKATAINITAAGSNISLKLNGASFDLGACVTLTPPDTWDKSVTYTSNNTTIATVTAAGIVTPVGVGATTITVRTADGSNISRDANVTVQAAVERWDDLNRTGWTVTTDMGNGLFFVPDGTIGGEPANILDECTGTSSGANKCLALAKPGRGIAAGLTAEVALDFNPYFVVDMKAAKSFNYFRWRHRTDNNNNRLKAHGVHVYVSSDGTTFTQVVPDEPEAPEHPKIYWIPIAGGYTGNPAQSDAANYYIINLNDEPISARYVKIELMVWSNNYGVTAQEPYTFPYQHPKWPGNGDQAFGNAIQISEFNVGFNYWD